MRRAAWLVSASVSAGAGAIVASIGLMLTAGYLVSRAAERPQMVDLMLLFVAVRSFGVLRPILRYVERLLSHDLMFRILRTVRGWFVGSLLPLSYGQLTGFRAGDLVSRMASDVDALQESYLRVIGPALVALMVFCGTVIAFARVSLTMAAVVAMFLGGYGVLWSWLAYRQSRAVALRRNPVRRDFSANLVAVLQGMDDVLTCGYEQRAVARFAEQQRVLDDIDRASARWSGVHAAAGVLFTTMAGWCILTLTLHAVAAGELTAVWIAPLMLATLAAFESVDGLPAAWQSAAHTIESARRVLEVVRTPPAITEIPEPVPIGCAVPAIEFDDVSFSYGGRAILCEVTLRIAPGEHIAIVGPTGAGKSTLLSLLVRSWDPSAGVVRINGIDLREADLDEVRGRIAVMPQQVHVFDDSLRENVRVARHLATDAVVMDALKAAGLSGFLSRTTHGLDTRLGEFGARMSAGERQRLGLARILLTDASLVLADEPTANLDARSETAFMRTLLQRCRHRTLLLVSHRRVALEHVERVVTLSDGHVKEGQPLAGVSKHFVERAGGVQAWPFDDAGWLV